MIYTFKHRCRNCGDVRYTTRKIDGVLQYPMPKQGYHKCNDFEYGVIDIISFTKREDEI